MRDEDLATAFVIGTLDAGQREAVRIRAIEDRAFAELIETWERKLIALALGSAVLPPRDALAKIEAMIGQSGVELPGTLTRRAQTGEWTDVSPGLRIKVMNRMPELNRWTFMAHLQPGAEYADHDHDQDEEIYMIEGDLIIGDVVLKAGDFHVAKAGRHHPTHRTTSGCICIISQAMGPI